MLSPLKRLLLGRPLPTSAARRERLTRITGPAVLSSGALSSVAYATDAMLEVLAPAGLLAIGYARPLALRWACFSRSHSRRPVWLRAGGDVENRAGSGGRE